MVIKCAYYQVTPEITYLKYDFTCNETSSNKTQFISACFHYKWHTKYIIKATH